MFFSGNATQPTGYKGNFGPAGGLDGVGSDRARRYNTHAFLVAGFLAFATLGGCAGNNNAELVAKINASYHTNFSTNAQPTLFRSAF
jgi:hypothetical protein